MRLIRYARGGRAAAGAVSDGYVHELAGTAPGARGLGPRVAPLAEVTLLPPCDPRVIVCAGSNYASQIREKDRPWPDRPALFLKAPNAVVGPGAAIERPGELDRLEYEGELAVVIGRTARGIAARSFADYVLGYTCANDVTAADWRSDGQWARAKSADTFCPLGPWIETGVPDPAALRLRTFVNGTPVQDTGTGDMVFGVGALLAYATRWFTLHPGDVLLTGSPSGVGPLTAGDEVSVDIGGVGRLTNPVVDRR
ncbi:fumarylacetoacetate hydrolase family protein [Streptomyces sp. DW26H14]|uniref:fumarylacetoacetate hydrolase family protein n=1 Tax=Streptomyces sp. DW26H14 TaxID=3435395 RepID=UPI00403D6CEC